MRTLKIIGVAALAAMAASGAALPAYAADKPAVYTARFSNVAVGGYDPVSYFADAGPVKGSKEFKTDHNGAEWRFASQANLDAFLADPAAYAPQYGGYCAWAASQGYTASGDPEVWTVHNGKLYLNYSRNVQKDWLQDKDGFIALADANWPGILSK